MEKVNRRAGELMMESHGMRHPEKALRVTWLGNRKCAFEYPRLDWEVTEELDNAIAHWRIGDLTFAAGEYRRLIDEYPEFIDAHHHLALLLDRAGREEEAFRIWQDVVAMGIECLPTRFEIGRDLLPWSILENRPFLRAYHSLGLGFLERGEIEKALDIFNNMLAMNPGDNQGARALTIDCGFRLNRPLDVLAICERYPDDGMEQVVYGRALALYQLGRKVKAERALREALEFLPLIARELVKERHRKPKGLHSDYVTHGGADQAYYYWIEQGTHWKNTSGALGFVKECLTKQ